MGSSFGLQFAASFMPRSLRQKKMGGGVIALASAHSNSSSNISPAKVAKRLLLPQHTASHHPQPVSPQ